MSSNDATSKFSQQYKQELHSLLVNFYTNVAYPHQDPRLYQLKEMVDTILKGVRERDPRFQFEVHDVGSVASGVSAVVACEIDILLCLDIEGSDEESERSPGFAKFKLTESSAKLWEDAVIGRYLHPRKISDIFHSLVNEVMVNLKNDILRNFSVGDQGSVAMTVTYNALEKYKADLVFAVKCIQKKLTSIAKPNWLQEGYGKEWPSTESIKAIKQNGYELVAKYVNESTSGIGDTGQDRELLWRVSVSRAETLLLKSFPDQGQNDTHKMCLVIFKALRMHSVTKAGHRGPVTYALTSYHLKTLLFHEAQSHPSLSAWTEDKLVDRFLSFNDTFYRQVKLKKLSTFFFPDVNLFQDRNPGGFMGDFIVPLYEDPLAYLKSIMSIVQSSTFRTLITL